MLKKNFYKYIILILFSVNILFSSNDNRNINNLNKIISKANYAEDVFNVDKINLKVPIEHDYGYLSVIHMLKDRRILLCYYKGSEILMFDSTGNFIKTIGRRGRGPGEFEEPWHIAELGNIIVVGDNTLRKLTFFDKGMKFLFSRTTKHEINGLSSINGDFFVANDYMTAKWRKHHDIYVYDKQGKVRRKFGKLLHAGKELRKIPHMPQGPHVVCSSGYIFQTDYCDYEIQKYDINGDLIKIFGEKPKGWKSLLTTNYKRFSPSMGFGALEKYWPEFNKCSMVNWISTSGSRYILSCISLKGDHGKQLIAVYNSDGELINPGLKIKTLLQAEEPHDIGLMPVQKQGFCLAYDNLYSQVNDKKGSYIIIKVLVYSLR